MSKIPESIQKKLDQRLTDDSLRHLSPSNQLVDFSSNDYLGFAGSEKIYEDAFRLLDRQEGNMNGATGSRLLSGNHSLFEQVEKDLAVFHNSAAALLFNSGYDANLGLLSAVPQRNDLILFDELCHASIRDGIQLSKASSYKYLHNDLEDLQKKLSQFEPTAGSIYVITESVFSMDGDSPDIQALVELVEKYKAFLILDEAHATGVYGEQGSGLSQKMGVENRIFARIHTFSKGLGCHGAVVLGSSELRHYLINFSRSFIYTTALPPHSLAVIRSAYEALKTTENRVRLTENIVFFNQEVESKGLAPFFIGSDSAIHSCIIKGNSRVKELSTLLKEKGYDVKPILHPTVPKDQERLRICLHSYNSEEEISNMLTIIQSSLAAEGDASI